MSRVGASLRSARARAGWSREVLAARAGVSGAAVAQIEAGRRQEVRLSTLLALADALGITADYLVGSEATAAPRLLAHRILVYVSDDDFLESATPFLVDGMAHGDCLIVIAQARLLGALRDALGDDASSVEFHDSSEWYRSPPETLRRYRDVVRERYQRGAPWIRVIGEPVWAGRSEVEITEWTRYESMINLVLASAPATVVCPYDARSVAPAILADAQRTHPEVARTPGPNPAYREPEEFLVTPL